MENILFSDNFIFSPIIFGRLVTDVMEQMVNETPVTCAASIGVPLNSNLKSSPFFLICILICAGFRSIPPLVLFSVGFNMAGLFLLLVADPFL